MICTKDFSSLRAPKGSAIFLEDTIAPNADFVREIKNALHYKMRHCGLHYFIVLHKITKNNTYELVSSVDTFVFTKDTRNKLTIKDVYRAYDLGRESYKPMCKDFLTRDEWPLYLTVQSEKLDENDYSIDVMALAQPGAGGGGGGGGSGGTGEGHSSVADAVSRGQIRQRVSKMLSGLKCDTHAQSLLLLDFLFDSEKFQNYFFSLNDLSLTLESEEGRHFRVSLIDVLHFASCAKAVTDSTTEKFFTTLARESTLPLTFLVNPQIRKLVQAQRERGGRHLSSSSDSPPPKKKKKNKK